MSLLVVGAVSVALLASALLQELALAGRPASSSLPLHVTSCERAVEVEGALVCDGEPLPFTGPVEIGRRVDAKGVPQEGESWLTGEGFEALGLPVDVEHADVERLSSLPGIGPERARRIVESRPLGGLAGLDTIPGVGPVTLSRLRHRARFGPARRGPPGTGDSPVSLVAPR